VTLEEWELVVAGILADADEGASFNLRADLAGAEERRRRPRRRAEEARACPTGQRLLASGQKKALDAALAKHLTLDDWGLTLQTPSSRARTLVKRYDVDGDGKLDGFEWRGPVRIKGVFMPKYAWQIDDHLTADKRRDRVRTEDDLRDAIARGFPYLALESKQLLLSPPGREPRAWRRRRKQTCGPPRRWCTCVGWRSVASASPAWSRPWTCASRGRSAPSCQPEPPLSGRQIVLARSGLRPGEGSADASGRDPGEVQPPEHRPDLSATHNEEVKFTLAGFVPPRGVAADPFLTPEFPGITDRDDVGAWDLPFDDPEWKKNISQEYGDRYWKEFPRHPEGVRRSRRRQEAVGQLAVRRADLDPPRAGRREPDVAAHRRRAGPAAERFGAALLKRLDPDKGGFAFDDVKKTGLEASKGGTPFGGLFLGFSSFLIVSALMLVGLLYRLNLERRARQVGVLSAEGFPAIDRRPAAAQRGHDRGRRRRRPGAAGGDAVFAAAGRLPGVGVAGRLAALPATTPLDADQHGLGRPGHADRGGGDHLVGDAIAEPTASARPARRADSTG